MCHKFINAPANGFIPKLFWSIRENRRNLYPYVLIFLFSFLVHSLLLINDGVYWDGWIIYSHLRDNNWESLYSLYHDYGTPWQAYQHWFFKLFPSIKLGYRLIGFVAIISFALLVYAILNETKVLSPVERLWITCLSVSQPVFQIFTAQITVTHCGISNLSLFLGILLVLKAEKCSGLKHLVLRFSAILVFLLCFTGMDYFLLFYYGALLFVFLYIDRFEKLSMKSSLVTYILHRLDYLLLPVFVWSLKSNIFPKRGLYISQYAFDFSVNKIARVYLGFFEFIYTQISNVLKETLTYPLQWLILGSIYFLFHWLFGKKLSDYLNKQEFQNIKPYILLLYGLFFLVISIFPFAATKEMRIPFSGDWEIRHAFLIPLPIAITLVGAFRLLFPGNEHQVFSKSGGAILFILLFGFTKSTLNDYIALQARWVKDSSFIYNIRKLEGAKEMSIFWIDDQFPIIGRYRFHEWAGMFKHAWGDETHFGWNKEELRYFNNPEELFLRLEPFYPNYLLADFNPRGCQVDLVIRKGNQATNNLSMVINYFYYKYLKSQNLPEYLDGIVNISVNPINKTSVTNCDLRRYKKQP